MTWKEILKLAREDASIDNRLIVYYDYVDGEYGIHPAWLYDIQIFKSRRYKIIEVLPY